MTLPASGPISFNDINVELGVSGTTQASLGQASYRTLAGVASGAISMSNFYGKANAFAFTISTNQTNANLRTLAVNAGWNQSTKVIATVDSGVYISSNSTGTPALTINGSFPGGVELVNSGYIVGMGGAGGAGGILDFGLGFPPVTNGVAGSGGGLALSVSSAVTITNNQTIGGGGGGGGGGGAGYGGSKPTTYSSGSGGGGGRTGTTNSAAGARGYNSQGYTYGGYVGNSGTSSAAGSGGSKPAWGGAGGSGGGWGSGGSSGQNATPGSGYPGSSGGSGGSAGGAVTGNSNITWIATGTRLGSIT